MNFSKLLEVNMIAKLENLNDKFGDTISIAIPYELETVSIWEYFNASYFVLYKFFNETHSVYMFDLFKCLTGIKLLDLWS